MPSVALPPRETRRRQVSPLLREPLSLPVVGGVAGSTVRSRPRSRQFGEERGVSSAGGAATAGGGVVDPRLTRPPDEAPPVDLRPSVADPGEIGATLPRPMGATLPEPIGATELLPPPIRREGTPLA